MVGRQVKHENLSLREEKTRLRRVCTGKLNGKSRRKNTLCLTIFTETHSLGCRKIRLKEGNQHVVL
jgi:hypothetical protein